MIITVQSSYHFYKPFNHSYNFNQKYYLIYSWYIDGDDNHNVHDPTQAVLACDYVLVKASVTSTYD